MKGLVAHCGANYVKRDALSQVLLPAEERRTHVRIDPNGAERTVETVFTPIAHDYFADLVEDRLNNAGLKVVESAFALGRNGADMFGIMQVGASANAEFATVVGLRNSHVKKLTAGLVIGRDTFVCDNLMFVGEIKFSRRHTGRILIDLGDLVTDAISKIAGISTMQEARVDAYKAKQLTTKHADHLIVQMLRDGVINTQRVEKVVQQWDTPDHDEFTKTGKSVWRMEQAVTESLKGSNIIQMPDRCQKLVTLLDTAAEYKQAA